MSITRHQAVGAYRPWVPEDFGAPATAADDAEEQPADTHADDGPPTTPPAGDEREAGTATSTGRGEGISPTESSAPAAAQTGHASAFADAQAGEEDAAEETDERDENAAIPATGTDSEAEAQAAALALPEDFVLPTAADIERMHEDIRAAAAEEGHREGYAAGFAEGERAGREQGHAEGLGAAREEARQLATLAGQLDTALQQLELDVAEELMSLAIELARQMVRQELAQRPEHLIDNIRDALTQLPQAQARIELHPDDLALTRELLGEELAEQGHRLHENPQLQRGDCLIEAGGAHLDARLETRWRRILESLGRRSEAFHLEPDEAAGPAAGSETRPADAADAAEEAPESDAADSTAADSLPDSASPPPAQPSDDGDQGNRDNQDDGVGS